MKSKTKTKEGIKVRKHGILLLVIIIGGLLVPFVIVTLTIKGPPLNFPTKQRIPIDDICGICHIGSSNTSSDEWVTMKQLGANWTRVDFHWSGIEPADDSWYWDKWDGFLNATEDHNVKVLALLLYDNVNVETVNPQSDKYIHPNDIPYFLDYVNQTVRRYKDRVEAWEIWNEPNIHFWDGPIEHFYDLFNQTQELIHQIEVEFSQNLTVLSASMAGTFSGFVPPEFEAMFEAGIMDYIDVVSMHFYHYDADSLYRGIMQHMVTAQKYGFAGDYWITEIGNPTGGEYAWRVSQEKLAENVIKSHVIASNLHVKEIMWYHDEDPLVPDPLDSEHFFGLVHGNGTWKPGAHAYSLFSNHCSNSILYQDLVMNKGGIAANDLVATLYRRANGNSTLIMWYDPTTYASGNIEVTLDLGAVGDIKIHDIYTGTNQTLSDTSIMVGNAPIFITFQAATISNPVTLHVEESGIALTLYIVIFITLISSLGLAVIVIKRR
ncbi:MAG: hypothetical protein HWN65_11775 [Candidatus Helarchaeota archaeon]|nr:hypothetical protein [Candidatus Helarchaeota archaeon]